MSNSLHFRSGSLYIISGSLTRISGSIHANELTGSAVKSTISLDTTDNSSLILTTHTASFYMSSSGQIGIGTTDPKSGVDIKANNFKIRSADGTKELEFTNEGKIITKEYGTSSSGSEMLLTFDRGTHDIKMGVQDGDTLGKIRWASISGSNIDQATAALIETEAISVSSGLPGGHLILKTARDGATTPSEIIKMGYAAIPEVNNQNGVLIKAHLNVKNDSYFTGSIHCYSTISGSSLGNTPINGGSF